MKRRGEICKEEECCRVRSEDGQVIWVNDIRRQKENGLQRVRSRGGGYVVGKVRVVACIAGDETLTVCSS